MRVRLSIFALSCIFLAFSASFAQSDSLKLKPRPVRHSIPGEGDSILHTAPLRFSNPLILAVAVPAGGGLIHILRYQPLWKNYKHAFFYHEDYYYARSQDKYFHFWGGTAAAEIFSSLYADEREPWVSLLYGGLTSALLLTIVEIEDGFISYEGFDRLDFAADLAGASYPLLQHSLPFFHAFTPKISYTSSGRSVTAQGQISTNFLNDHQGQRFWIGISIEELLPRSIQQYWPDILGVAIGRQVTGLQTPLESVNYFLALDVDLRQINTDVPLLNKILTALNYIHLPLPAVKLSRSAVWYGIYF